MWIYYNYNINYSKNINTNLYPALFTAFFMALTTFLSVTGGKSLFLLGLIESAIACAAANFILLVTNRIL